MRSQEQSTEIHKPTTVSYEELVSEFEARTHVKRQQVERLFKKIGWSQDGEWTISASSETEITLGKVGSSREYRIGVLRMAKPDSERMKAMLRSGLKEGTIVKEGNRFIGTSKRPEGAEPSTPVFMPHVQERIDVRGKVASILG